MSSATYQVIPGIECQNVKVTKDGQSTIYSLTTPVGPCPAIGREEEEDQPLPGPVALELLQAVIAAAPGATTCSLQTSTTFRITKAEVVSVDMHVRARGAAPADGPFPAREATPERWVPVTFWILDGPGAFPCDTEPYWEED